MKKLHFPQFVGSDNIVVFLCSIHVEFFVPICNLKAAVKILKIQMYSKMFFIGPEK
jgi:hypothetical protein